LPTNADIWPEIRYFGDTASLLGTLNNPGLANVLSSASNWTADSVSAWDSGVPVRINTHAYSTGDIISPGSNPGRVFFCTSAGLSAGSLPGGYATAVDGGSVTDNTAVFRAGFRFSMAVTLSAPQPKIAGLITIQPKVAKASSTFYIDPPQASSIV
jgi:hypothetical protein